MIPLAHRSIEADLDRLERQRLGYALAHASSQDDRARTRHERTLSRLDDEIGALHEALHAIVDARPSAFPQRLRGDDAVPVLEQTAELTAAEYDELRPKRAPWLWPTLGAGALAVIVGLWWATRPAPPPPTPTIQPPAVIVSSPVPPDSDVVPAR